MSVLSFLVYTIIGQLSLIVYKIRKSLNYWQSLGIPVEEPNFIVGNMTGIQTTRSFADVWLSYYKKFRGTGPFAGFYFFQIPSVFILDTALVKNILIKDFSNFADRGFYLNEKDDPLAAHLFFLDGRKWKNLRSKISPTFTSGKMKYMFPTVVEVGKKFVQVFDDMLQRGSDVEVKELLARFTTDVIGTCAFGIDCNSLNDPQAEFRIMGTKAIRDQRHGKLGLAFISRFPDLAKMLRMKQTPDHIEAFYMRIVRETVAHREANNIRRNDFMDLLIDMKNNKMIKSETGEDLTNLTLEEIAAQAFVFFAAGFETSSSAMGYALYELAQHEEIQQKARDEIEAVLKKHNGEFTYEVMKELRYLEQVISETLRLYTILPVINRKCLADYVVPGHPNYVIKKDMLVVIPAGGIHLDEKYYPNPHVFDPDRFTPEMVAQRDSVEWMPFGDGPRNCVGLRFGQMQTRIGLALLLKHFRFSVCSQTQIPLKYDKTIFISVPEGGIHLRVERV